MKTLQRLIFALLLLGIPVIAADSIGYGTFVLGTGVKAPIKLIDNGDGTYSFATGSTSSSGTISTKATGSASIANGQVALSTSSGQVVAAAATRRSVCIRNHDASISIYVGVTGVTSSTGILIKAGESITITTAAAVYAVAASGTPTAGYLTESD